MLGEVTMWSNDPNPAHPFRRVRAAWGSTDPFAVCAQPDNVSEAYIDRALIKEGNIHHSTPKVFERGFCPSTALALP